MRILVTGALGNIGTSTTLELVRQGHTVRAFDLETAANKKRARRLERAGVSLDICWGDLRRKEDLLSAVESQDVVIHLAFIIPKLSATGFESEDHPDWAWEINVGGTQNLIAAMKAQPDPPRLVFASSYHIYGRTQHLEPPRTVWDPPQPIEHYAHHKVECERLVRESGLQWAILRLAATLPVAMRMDPGMFDIPLDNRMEYVHTKDAGLAFANAASSRDVWRKILHVGGGPRCQYTYRQIAEAILEGFGVGTLPEEAFAVVPFPTDWLDTGESQRLLQYQRHTLDDYVQDMIALMGSRSRLVRAFRPLIRSALLKQSPHYQAGKTSLVTAALQGLKALKGKPARLKIG
jgi:UDP-glucose 4-epimerase